MQHDRRRGPSPALRRKGLDDLVDVCAHRDAVGAEATLAWDGMRCRATDLRRARLDGSFADGRWEHVDGRGMTWHGTRVGLEVACSTLSDARIAGDAQRTRWVDVDLRGARFEAVDLRDALLVRCDLSDSRWRDVDLRGARLLDCALDHARIEGGRWDGVTLSGCSLRGAWLGASLADIGGVDGADFRGAAPLDAALRGRLRAGGGQVGLPGLLALWGRLLGDARAPAATEATWTALALLVPAVFFGRAILDPVDPEQRPAWVDPGWEDPPDEDPGAP